MPATVLSPEESEGIIGKSVRSAAGEDMGRIVDVIVTTGTQPRAAVIDFGGFLGVGSRKIAVDWRLLQYSRNGKTWAVTVALNRNQLRVSPEYKPGEPVVVLGMPAPPPVPVPPAAAPVAAAPPTPSLPASAPASDPPAASPPAQEGSGDTARPPQR